MNEGAHHRQLMILGMLLDRPMYGHQIKETIDVHMEGFHDLKRANLYYLLDRMVDQSYLEVRIEQPETDEQAPKLVERRVFYITEPGRDRFRELLRQVLTSAEAFNNPVDVAFFFLPHLPKAEALELLGQRRTQVWEHYQAILEHIQEHPDLSPLHDIANDHLVSYYQMEIAWLDRARDRLTKEPSLRSA